MDALKLLEINGFIEIIPQSGCKVIDYSKKNILDQLLLSSSLESLCAELAALHSTKEEIEQLERFHSQLKERPEELRDRFNYLNYTRGIHKPIVLMSHSEIIIKNTVQIWALTGFYLLNSFDYFMFDPLESFEAHDKIINSIKNRSAKEAKRAMEEYTLNYIEKLKICLP